MPKLDVINMSGSKVGDIELSDEIFAVEPNVAAMHQMVVNYLASQRQGTQSALTRSEVSGGGRKPWRQKGTGHARQGSTRAPQWTHGGVVFAPKPRSYRFKVNKKVKRLAMKSAFSSKVIDNDLIIIDEIKTDEYKTKTMVKMLSDIKAEKKPLIVLDSVDKKVIKSVSNIPKAKTTQVNTLNVYDIMNADKLVITQAAIKKIEEVYA
ncbi:MAG: 50S ribosomal protein L4 [Clostridia bacterium]|nr:50S ribosomal protein L4 [Clostridia bacterium]